MDYSAPLVESSRPPGPPFRWLKSLLTIITVAIVVLGGLVSAARYVVILIARRNTGEVIARLDRGRSGLAFRADRGRASGAPRGGELRLDVPWRPVGSSRRIGQQSTRRCRRKARTRRRMAMSRRSTLHSPACSRQTLSIHWMRSRSKRCGSSSPRRCLPSRRPESSPTCPTAGTPWPGLSIRSNVLARTAAGGPGTGWRGPKLDAILRMHDGDFDGVLASCRAEFNVGRSLGDEPLLMSQLVRIAIESPSIRTIEHVSFTSPLMLSGLRGGCSTWRPAPGPAPAPSGSSTGWPGSTASGPPGSRTAGCASPGAATPSRTARSR